MSWLTPSSPDARPRRAPQSALSLPGDVLWRSVDVVGHAVRPRYFGARDAAWLGALIEVYALHAGRPKTELRERLREPLGVEAPRGKLRVATAVLDRLTRGKPTFRAPPRRVRALLFESKAAGLERERALEVASRELGLSELELEATLFADLPLEDRVAPLTRSATPEELALEINLAMASSLLGRARVVRLSLHAGARSVVRHVRLRGLIGRVVQGSPDGDVAELEISGPFALFRHTTLYGRHLAALIPVLSSSGRFRLVADCVLGSASERFEFVLSSSDPLPSLYESAPAVDRVRERFVRDFAALDSDWLLRPEPAPTWARGALVFADFEIVHREDSARRFWLTIVGYWTRAHLDRELELAREAGVRSITCIDRARGCCNEDVPDDAPVIRYRTKIDAARVLAVVEAQSSLESPVRTAASMSGP